MAKYRKKPVVIEATQWFEHGDHPDVYVPDAYAVAVYELESRMRRGEGPFGMIDTLEGKHLVIPGDWIITGIAGEVYPCKPDIFSASYEPVD